MNELKLSARTFPKPGSHEEPVRYDVRLDVCVRACIR